jgi:hypothetical protein
MAAELKWFWLNTTYACGAVVTNSQGVIVSACPIYLKFKGRHINDVIRGLRRNRTLREWKTLLGDGD